MDGFSLNSIFEYFSKMCRENSNFYKNLTRITGTLYEDKYNFLSFLFSSAYNEKFFSQKLERKSKYAFYALLLLFENRCRIMWKNIVEPDRPQMAI
jgi:hypothetical protein